VHLENMCSIDAELLEYSLDSSTYWTACTRGLQMSSIFSDQQRPRSRGMGGGCGASANEYSCAHHVTWNPNIFGDPPPYIICGLYGFLLRCWLNLDSVVCLVCLVPVVLLFLTTLAVLLATLPVPQDSSSATGPVLSSTLCSRAQ
jgi:hypothetical protein